MFWTHRGVIKPGAYGVGSEDLPIPILQNECAGAMEDTHPPTLRISEAGSVLAHIDAQPPCFHPDQPYWVTIGSHVIPKSMKETNGIRTSPDTGNEHIRQSPLHFQDLSPRLVSDD